MKTFVILDGSGYVFRAYYGLPELHDKDGHNVNAIFGFFRMLFKLWQRKPDYFAIAWDAPVKTVRKEMDETYKANRTKMPDEFKWQMGMIKELVGQLHIPAEEIPGYEADDIIGTLAWQVGHDTAQYPECAVQIVSSDKDLKQLVRTDCVTMYDTMKYVTTTESSFRESYGFGPELMVDYLAIVGDSADNISGIPGIGKVGASKLIQQRGSMEDIYAHVDEITGSIQQKLIDGKEQAFHAKTLTQLMLVPGYEEKHIDTWLCKPDFTHIEEILIRGCGFQSLQKVITETKQVRQGGEQLSLFG